MLFYDWILFYNPGVPLWYPWATQNINANPLWGILASRTISFTPAFSKHINIPYGLTEILSWWNVLGKKFYGNTKSLKFCIFRPFLTQKVPFFQVFGYPIGSPEPLLLSQRNLALRTYFRRWLYGKTNISQFWIIGPFFSQKYHFFEYLGTTFYCAVQNKNVTYTKI